MIKYAQIFYHIGKYSASNKTATFAFCFTVTVILGLGLLNLQLLTDPQDLWVDKTGRANTDQDFFKEKFGAFFRINQLILKLETPDPEENLFEQSYLKALYYLQVRTTKNGDRDLNIGDFCFKPISDKGCYLPSPLDYWKMNITDLMSDEDVKYTALCIKSRDPSEYIPCSDKNGIPVIRNVVLGNITCVSSGSEPCSPCKPKASALMVTFMLNNDKFTQGDAEVWEKNVWEDTINQFNAGTFDPKLYLNETIYPHELNKKVKVTYLAERSIPDELNDETGQNIWVVVISYLIMFLYISLAIGSFPSKVYTGFLVGISGIILVAFSIVSAIGLASYCGLGLSLISSEVVPFLILAIGVDNMFIIANAAKRVKADSIPEKMGKALKEVGPSISTAAICEFLAFIVGLFTKIPALQTFCVIAAIAVIIDFFFQITAFVAILALDEQRRLNRRADVLFCIQFDEVDSPRKDFIKYLIDSIYIPVLYNKFVQIFVYIAFIALLLLSVLGCFKIEKGLEQQVSLITDSNTYNYFNDQARYGMAGPPAYIVLDGVNYTNDYDIEIIRNMSDSLSRMNETILPPIYFWFSAFNQFISPGASWQKDCGTKDIMSYSFNERVKMFKNVKIDSKCCKAYGICGETYEKDIVFDEEGNIAATRLRLQHQPLAVSAQFTDAYVKTQQVVDYYSDLLNKNPNATNSRRMFPYSLFYVYFDQYNFIRGVALQNLLFAVGVVYIAIMIIKNTRTALFVFLCVLCTSFDVIGLSFLSNELFGGFPIQVNAVSVVNLIIAVGLSVEFCVHVMLCFMNSEGNRVERSKKALSVMGSSVVVGICMTKLLGVIVLGFAESTLFRLYYFRMYMAIIILGTFHGLIFLPVLLSHIGPRGSKDRKMSQERPFIERPN